MTEELDFVAVGDITTDEFIQLKKDKVNISKGPDGHEILSMSFGDKLEYDGAVTIPAVGNSPNAAVSSHRLGLRSALVTDIGDDEGGEEMCAQLEKEGIDMQFVEVHPNKLSNHHYVLRCGAERTILIKHEKYNYTFPNIGSPKWIYFSSVGENSLPYHHEIAEYLTKCPTSKLAFQPGSFQIQLGYEALKDIYAVSELFFCNKEEAMRILKRPNEHDMHGLLRGMRELGPKIVVITDGRAGAFTFDGSEMWHMPMYPDPAPPVDRTGAGDSFSSTFTAALALGHDIPTALSWGPVNSMNVVQYIGAQEGLLTREKLEALLKDAPTDYKPERIT